MSEFMTQLDAIEQCYRLADNRPGWRNTPKVTLPDWHFLNSRARQIRLAARRLSVLHLSQCNGVIGADGFARWNDDDQANYEKKCGAAEKAATAAFVALFPRGFRIDWQRDPRGPSIVVYDRRDSGGQNRLASFW